MKIELFDIKEFKDINHLEEITVPFLFEHGDLPHSKGLISNEIFGISPKDRKETFAVINLHGHYLHPHVYKVLSRIFHKLKNIISGEEHYSIAKDGHLVRDENNGDTGIKFLYDNWEKIKWDKDSKSELNMRNNIIDLITGYKKDIIFQSYEIVIPAFYRDVRTKASGGNETDSINTLYAKLIRLANNSERSALFDFQQYGNEVAIQNTLVEIYDYFKTRMSRKTGILRKFLMGKTVDYCTRAVITAETFHAERPEELEISYEYSSVPISHACVLVYPFVFKYVKDFFERNLMETNERGIVYDVETDQIISVTDIEDPTIYYSDKFIQKLIDRFIQDPSSRFNKLEIKGKNGKTYYIHFTGRRYNAANPEEMSTIYNRPMTYTDLLYMACIESVKGKTMLATRYPVLDEYGTFFTKIRISSTTRTIPMYVNEELYPYYPIIDFSIPKHDIGIYFIDSMRFSNSYLPGIDGDYDGDQLTFKILYTQEANDECNKFIYKKDNFISASGENMRRISKEAYQTFFVITKDPLDSDKVLSDSEKAYFLTLDPKDITFSFLVDLFGNTKNANDKINSKLSIAKYKPTNIIKIKAGETPLTGGKELTTTLGRLIFAKVLIEGLGFNSLQNLINEPMTAKRYKKFEKLLIDALIDDKITTTTFIKYIDTRDWFGLQLHPIVAGSFTPRVLKVPPEVKALKKKLLSENQEALDKGDYRVAYDIERKLISASLQSLEGDPGLDLYNSGARGSVNNHLKNMNLMRGAVYNSVTGKYDVITNSLHDGLAKKDIAAHANVNVNGSYPKAKAFKTK